VTTAHVNTIDYGYFDTYGLKFVTGRAFSNEFVSDEMSLILNESAMESVGFENAEDALRGKLAAGGREYTVLGVVKNHHHTSLKTSYEPIVYILTRGRTVYLSLNLNTKNLPQTIKAIESEMKEHFPENPFEYFFLDQLFDQEFKAELRYTELFKIFSILAIVLASLGLFGLASYLITQRSKEIGIRKVLGATGIDLFKLLSSSFLVPVILGIVIASVILYFGGAAWLQTFPFRINIQWLVFVVPLVMVLMMTGITLAIQTINAMRMEHAKAVRNE